ncbi:hypothetical protein [Nonomuraea sp. NPDC001023]|uniref:hypothetical protein n=1 Tax=unclassified Nonomuraea TaxID=2593643 RepID=UPI00331B48CE
MWIERARELYERGIYAGDDAALAASDRELDAVEAASNQVGLIHIAVAQGRHDEALALADEARALAKSCGADRVAAHVEEARATIPT